MLYEYSPPQTVEQILARTRVERLTKIYNLPTFNTTLEFLTMLALVPAASFPPLPTSRLTLKTGRDNRRARRSAPSARRLEPPQKTVHLRAARRARAVHDPGHGLGPGTAQVVAPGTEMTSNAQYVSALGAPFVLEGLFGEADAEAMMDADAGPSGRRSASGLLPFSAGMEVDNR